MELVITYSCTVDKDSISTEDVTFVTDEEVREVIKSVIDGIVRKQMKGESQIDVELFY